MAVLVLSSAHGKPSRSSARFSGTGAAALAGSAAIEERSPAVGSGAAGRGASAIGKPLGAATGGERAAGAAESGTRGTQTASAPGGPGAGGARAEAWAGSYGLRHRAVDGVAGGAPDRAGVRRPLPCLAGLAHPAATGLELSASGGARLERDEEKIRRWKQKRWPEIKKKPKKKGEPSSSSTKAG